MASNFWGPKVVVDTNVLWGDALSGILLGAWGVKSKKCETTLCTVEKRAFDPDGLGANLLYYLRWRPDEKLRYGKKAP